MKELSAALKSQGQSFSCPPSCWGSCCKSGITIEKPDAGNILSFAERNFDRFAVHFNDKQQALQDVTGDGRMYGAKIVNEQPSETPFAFFRLITHDAFGKLLPNNVLHSAALFDPVTETPISCIFLTEKKSCFLEDIAIDIGLHRWYAKPIPCIAFPLVLNTENKYAPLSSDESRDGSRTNEGLYRSFHDKACCKAVTEEGYPVQMQEALRFIEEQGPKRKERYSRLLATLKTRI